MKSERKLAYAVRRWEMKDVLVLLLIIITILLAAWTIQLEQTKYVVIVVEEKVKDEIRLYKAKSKDKIEELVIKNIKI